MSVARLSQVQRKSNHFTHQFRHRQEVALCRTDPVQGFERHAEKYILLLVYVCKLNPPPAADERTVPLGSYLDDIEKDAIRKALEQAKYNKTAAAKLLGMSFRQLRYRIKKLGLE